MKTKKLSYFLNNYIPQLNYTKTAAIIKWEYKGYKIEVEKDKEEDNAKLFNYVLTPDGQTLVADVPPYELNPEKVNEWIENTLIKSKNKN